MAEQYSVYTFSMSIPSFSQEENDYDHPTSLCKYNIYFSRALCLIIYLSGYLLCNIIISDVNQLYIF